MRWVKRASHGIRFVHLFVSSSSLLRRKLVSLRSLIDPAGTIWISWPKKRSGVETDVTEDVVRKIALPLGLVDIKVCAVNEIWSGLKLVVRKEQR